MKSQAVCSGNELAHPVTANSKRLPDRYPLQARLGARIAEAVFAAVLSAGFPGTETAFAARHGNVDNACHRPSAGDFLAVESSAQVAQHSFPLHVGEPRAGHPHARSGNVAAAPSSSKLLVAAPAPAFGILRGPPLANAAPTALGVVMEQAPPTTFAR